MAAPYNSMYVANYVIEYCNEKEYDINNLKLQKILYYLQARNLVERNIPLFDEPIQKWKFGPVVPSVYHDYKTSGASKIKKSDIGKILRLPKEGETPNMFETYILEEYSEQFIDSEDDKVLIEDTVDKLKKYTPFSLVDLTHDQELWLNDRDRIEMGIQNIEYANNEIQEFFETHEGEQIWNN